MLWLIDTLQNKVSADQYHMIIYLKFRALQGDVFVEEDRLPSAGFFRITVQFQVHLLLAGRGY